MAPGQVDTLDIEKEKEIIGEQEIVYDEFVEEADMEDVENEDDDAAKELLICPDIDIEVNIFDYRLTSNVEI